MRFNRPEPLPTVFFCLSFLVLMALGTWQMQRLAWKESLIAATEKAQAEPTLASLPQEVDGLLYRKVTLTGRFDYAHTLHLIGRQQGVDMGFYMVTPLSLDDDGRIILVNRGFSPVGKEAKPEGLVTVSGILRPLREKRALVPDNVPDKNIWTYEDLDAIEKMLGKRPLPFVLEVVGTPQPGVYPMPDDGKVIFRNDHLGYAVTWYGMALVSIVMFAAYYRKR